MTVNIKNIGLTFLFLVAFFQYSNTLTHDFAWDDKLVITGNEFTKKGISALPDIFINRLSVPHKNVYRPVPQSLFAIEYELFGERADIFHFLSVLWYALLCLTVFCFVRFVFPDLHWLIPYFVAMLFTVHPLHVEVVANIKSRDEILALFLGLWGVIFIARGIEKNAIHKVFAGIFFLSLSLLSKENAITLLPVIPLVVWFRASENKIGRKVVLAALLGIVILGIYYKLVPLVILALLVFLVLYKAIALRRRILLATVMGLAALLLLRFDTSGGAANQDLQLDSTVLNNIFLWTTESDNVIPTSIVNIGRYFKLFLFPHPLIHLYGYNQVPLTGWGNSSTWLVLALLLLSLLWLKVDLPRKGMAAFGILFFILTYTIYSNFFVLAPDTMADRYMFFPSVGLSLVAVSALLKLGGIDPVAFGSVRQKLVAGFFLLVLGCFFARTWIANKDWENDYTLIVNRIPYMKQNAAAQATLGIMLQRKSNEASVEQEQRKLRSEAARAFTAAIDIYPDFYLAWTLMGKVFVEEGLYEKAELAFLKAQRISPLSPDAYQCLGALYFVVGDTGRAVDYLEKSILFDPQLTESYVLLGKAYIHQGNLVNLGSLTETALKWFPEHAEFEAFQAYCLLNKNRFKEASRFARAALARDPNNILALSVISATQLRELGNSE